MRGPVFLGAFAVLMATLGWLLWPARVSDAPRADSRPEQAVDRVPTRPATASTLVRESAASAGPSRPTSVAASLRGRVVEKGASPIAGASLRVSWVVSPKEETREAHGDGEGRFLVEDLPARKLTVLARADGFARRGVEVETRAGECVDVEIQLVRGWTVLGRVCDAAGVPLGRASVQVDGHALGARSGAMTEADGAFRVDQSTASPELLRVALSGYLEKRVRLHWRDPNQRVQNCEVVLTALPPVPGRLLDERGRPLPGWIVYADSKLPYPRFSQASTDVGGHFSLRLDEGRYRIALIEKEGIAGFFCDWVGEVEAGAPELTITVPDRVRPSAFVSGVLVDTGGDPLAKALFTLCLACGSRLRSAGPTDAQGAFRLGPLPPQKVRIFVRRAGTPWPLFDLGEFDLAPEEKRDLGVVRMPIPASIAISASEADGRPVEKATVQAVHENGENVALVDLREGRARLELSPGTYSIVVGGRYLPNRKERVTVYSGALANLEFTMTPGKRQELAIEIPGAESAGKRCHLILHRPDGSTERSSFDPEVSADLLTRYVFYVARGDHRVEIMTDAGKRFAAKFTMSALEGDADWLLLRAETLR